MKSSEYWQERAKYLENRKYNMSASAMNNVNVVFDRAQAEIQKEIDVWFNRLAANNGISITEARKLLNKNELKEFHWDLETYIKHGQENAINQKWIKELENASAKFHISKFEALKMRTQQAYEKAFGGELDSIDKLMRDVYTDSFYRGSYELAKGIGIGHRIGGIDESKLNHILKTPWAADGKNFSDRIWQRKNEMVNTLHQELMRTCIMGKTPDDAIKTLTAFVGDNVKNAKYAASRLAYTEAAYAYAEGIKESYSIAEVEEYEYLATLDDRTSEICQEMDGKHFPMSEYSPGITAPPLHPNCRSVTVPYNDAIEKLIGDTVYVPGDITYKDWYKQFVVGDRSVELTKASQKDMIKSKDYVMRGLADISKVKSNNDIETFAEQLIDNLNINRSDIAISVKGISDNGHCVFGQGTTQDIIHYKEYVLNANDKRSMTHRLKTAFHESFHLSAEGMKWDGLDSSGRIKEVWRSLEETFTESSAHYMLERYGVIAKIAPSYPKELVINLPRLKQLPKYSACNTIQDFGEIAFADRQNGIGAKWIDLSQKMKKVKLADDYYKQYHKYILDNEDDLFDMFLKNMPGFEQYRPNMKIDLKLAMNKDRSLLNDNEQTVYYGILSCAMQKVGVK